MKLNFKKIFLISSILILIVFLPDINLYYQRYKLRNEKLPDKYKNQTELENVKIETSTIKENLDEAIKKNDERSELLLQQIEDLKTQIKNLK